MKFEEVNMKQMIADIIMNHEYRMKKTGILAEVSELPECIGDRMSLDQVFSNIIDNAIKYYDPERPGVINISGHRDGIYTVYTVEDNGIGIDSKHKDRIFELFYQREPDKLTGEGLGMTIALKIIDRHNGKIRVESEPGKGSKFIVSLPYIYAMTP